MYYTQKLLQYVVAPMKECVLKKELHVNAIKWFPRDYAFIDNRIFLLQQVVCRFH